MSQFKANVHFAINHKHEIKSLTTYLGIHVHKDKVMEVDVKSVFLAVKYEIEHKVLLVVATVKKHRLRACFDQIIQNTLFLFIQSNYI